MDIVIMEVDAAIAMVAFATSIISLIYSKSWKDALGTVVYISFFILIYLLAIKIFGQKGNNMFAGVFVFVSAVFLYFKAKSEKSVGW